MAGMKRRAASTASGSTQATQRNPSRASTESIHSAQARNSPHPLELQLGQRQMHQPGMSVTSGMAEQQQQHHLQQQPNVLHPLEAMLRAGTVLGSPSLVDPALQMPGDFPTTDMLNHAAVTRGSSYSAMSQDAYNSPNLTNGGTSIGGGPQSGIDAEETKKKRGSTCTATNDRELRELISRNEGRGLRDVATEVIATERTPRAEKSKQLFAMVWLRSKCKTAKNSVPRNRVYAHYARRCGTERVTPLNPASFGKLVRVIFPGIQTRRLGVRGESKYHYVDLALVEENGTGDVQSAYNGPHRHHLRQDSVSTQMDYKLSADTAAFPMQDHDINSFPVQETAKASRAGLFADPFTPGFNQNGPTAAMYEHTLKFPPPEHTSFTESDTIELPDIRPYCPPKTDIDSLEALSALYRTHCTSLVDCVRFCKEKQFFRLYTSFHGTLTMPVQKLFAHASIAPWIRECDWLMYQKMVRFVSQLTLQVAPPVVLKFLDTISKLLHSHISQTFQGHPLHVLEAKLEPATLFAGLLHRMLRVNSSAHAAAALLMIDQTRDQMWQDWVQYVNPKRIMESELPNCGYAQVYPILVDDIKNVLAPSSTPTWLENRMPYPSTASAAAAVGQNGAMNGAHDAFNPNLGSETVIDRLATFLMSLPTRFPQVETRTLLYCISALGTAALREITVENGLSYQPWWITKVFIDEMSLWLASMGGFLDHKAPGHAEAVREREREVLKERQLQQPQRHQGQQHGVVEGHGHSLSNSLHSVNGVGENTFEPGLINGGSIGGSANDTLAHGGFDDDMSGAAAVFGDGQHQQHQRQQQQPQHRSLHIHTMGQPRSNATQAFMGQKGRSTSHIDISPTTTFPNATTTNNTINSTIPTTTATTSTTATTNPNLTPTEPTINTDENSHDNNASATLTATPNHSFPFDLTTPDIKGAAQHAAMDEHQHNDDSGIGISLMDEDDDGDALGLGKFGDGVGIGVGVSVGVGDGLGVH